LSMGFEQDAAAVGRAADESVAALQAELNEAQAAYAALSGENAALQAERAVLLARIAELEAIINPPPPPPPPPSTLFGVTVTGPVRKEYTDLHPKVAVSRVFGAGTSDWSQEPQHKAFPNGKWAVSNSYALSESALPRYLATIPDADKAKIVGYADGHELEHPDKGLWASDVRARVKRTAPIIRAAGLKPTWCMMGYSLRNDDWLNWVDPDDVDLLAFDKYNSGNKKTPPIYQDPVKMVDEAVAASRRFGKPFAFWETGTNQFGDDAARVDWTKALRAELIRQGAVCAIWFDRKSTSGSSWDASLDRASAEAWLA